MKSISITRLLCKLPRALELAANNDIANLAIKMSKIGCEIFHLSCEQTLVMTWHCQCLAVIQIVRNELESSTIMSLTLGSSVVNTSAKRDSPPASLSFSARICFLFLQHPEETCSTCG